VTETSIFTALSTVERCVYVFLYFTTLFSPINFPMGENNWFLHYSTDFCILYYWTEEKVQMMLRYEHLSLARPSPSLVRHKW
jgi:hypothetical protein